MKQQCFNGDGKHPNTYQDLENKALEDINDSHWGACFECCDYESLLDKIKSHLQLAYEAGKEEEKKMQTPPEFIHEKELESRNEIADYWYRHGVRCARERFKEIINKCSGIRLNNTVLGNGDFISKEDLLNELTK